MVDKDDILLYQGEMGHIDNVGGPDLGKKNSSWERKRPTQKNNITPGLKGLDGIQNLHILLHIDSAYLHCHTESVI